jgi:Uma2 family endonuclease
MFIEMLDWEALFPDRRRPLFRSEYDRLVTSGAFADERIELLRGVLVQMSPQSPRHVLCCSRLAEVLVLELSRVQVLDRTQVCNHAAFAATDDSEPEPDLTVIPRQSVGDELATSAFLVVEVSRTSLRKDRVIKAPIYAEANIPEYWIVDVDGECVEVHTDPHDGAYRTVTIVKRGATLRPIELPGVAIAVDAILPPPA